MSLRPTTREVVAVVLVAAGALGFWLIDPYATGPECDDTPEAKCASDPWRDGATWSTVSLFVALLGLGLLVGSVARRAFAARMARRRGPG